MNGAVPPGPVDLLTFGESMASLRTAGALRSGGTLAMHLAGAESNVAIGLARLGHSTRWAGRVGADEVGEFVLGQLRQEGVRVDGAPRDGVHPTGMMLLEQRTADISRAHYYRAGSAGSALTVADIGPALAAGARVLHLTGITPALSASARDATLWAARTAAEAGIMVSLDLNYRSKLWSRPAAREVLRELAPHAGIIIASDDELDLLADPRELDSHGSGAGDEEALAQRLLGSGVSQVVVKRGAAGATLYSAEGTLHETARRVTSVDTVGAGDAFCAGYLSALLDGRPYPERLARGALLGAFAVSTRGDWEGLPQRNELELLGAHGPGSTVR